MQYAMTLRQQRRADKTVSEYEPVAPSCHTCKSFHPERLAQPKHGLPYLRPLCERHAFVPNRHGLCNLWEDRKTGETLT